MYISFRITAHSSTRDYVRKIREKTSVQGFPLGRQLWRRVLCPRDGEGLGEVVVWRDILLQSASVSAYISVSFVCTDVCFPEYWRVYAMHIRESIKSDILSIYYWLLYTSMHHGSITRKLFIKTINRKLLIL